MAIAALYPSTKPSLNLDFANTKTLDPRITFSRASTATYYDGKTFAKAEENLLTYSQEFDNAYWLKQDATVTANAIAAPDGAATAEKISMGSTSTWHAVYSVVSIVSGSTYTFSAYAKISEYSFIGLVVSSNQARRCFDISAGTIGSSAGLTNTASIVSVGNGWYRISMTFTANTTTTTNANLVVMSINSDPVTPSTGDGTSGIYIWGAQLEQRSSATAYTPTTSQPITNYIPVLQTAASNIPRFNHDPTKGESLGLLIEEQRTNLLLRSQEFDDAQWSYANSVVSSNTLIAPDGTLTSAKWVEDGIYGARSASQTRAITSGTTYTRSVYAKYAGRHLQLAGSSGFTTSDYANFDLVNGIVGTTNGAVTASINHVGNGWYRCSLSAISTGTAGQIAAFMVSTTTSARGELYTGDGYSGIYIWGAQLEVGSFPTSYIPTTTAQVTRSADAASMTGSNFSSWYRQDEGSLFIENNYNHGGTDDGKTALHVDNAAGSRFMLHNSGSLNRLVVTVNNTEVVSISGATPASKSFVKTAFAIKTNDFASSSNAANASVDTSGNVPIVSAMRLGTYESPGYELNGHIKRLCYWPSRLSNSVLQALTT